MCTPAGAYLHHWESAEFDRAVSDVFGYHAMQLGLPTIATLGANRMPHAYMVLDRAPEPRAPRIPHMPVLAADFAALPFAESSVDLVTMPHTLELNGDPHGCLREVHRVLVPEGKAVICGLNPMSLWGIHQKKWQILRQFGWQGMGISATQEWIGYRRLRDWLRLLSFEVESVRFGCYFPHLQTASWIDRLDWMNDVGARWWPILGGVYFVVAVKRVEGVRVLGRPWKPARKIVSAAPVSVANSVPEAGLTRLTTTRKSP